MIAIFLNPRAANQFEDELEAITTRDDVLVESAKKGDADSFAKLMDRYGGFCLSRAYRFREIAAMPKMKFRIHGYWCGHISSLIESRERFARGLAGYCPISV